MNKVFSNPTGTECACVIIGTVIFGILECNQ